MLACPVCAESDRLQGAATGDQIEVTCESCGHRWTRGTDPTCDRCGAAGMFAAIAAIVEKGRGTQLSVVGTRTVHLCEQCDAATIRHYLSTRPNPLMPDRLPNTPGDE